MRSLRNFIAVCATVILCPIASFAQTGPCDHVYMRKGQWSYPVTKELNKGLEDTSRHQPAQLLPGVALLLLTGVAGAVESVANWDGAVLCRGIEGGKSVVEKVTPNRFKTFLFGDSSKTMVAVPPSANVRPAH
jgi:hypothetical protein